MALQIPVQKGLHLFAYNESLTWSIEHFITAFECAVFLAYWLLAIEGESDQSLTTAEQKIKQIVIEQVDQSEEKGPDYKEADAGSPMTLRI